MHIHKHTYIQRESHHHLAISSFQTSLENYRKDMKEKLRDKDKEVEEKEIDIASLKDALAKKEDEISAVKVR